MSLARSLCATDLRGFSSINAYAATVAAPLVSRLAVDLTVAGDNADFMRADFSDVVVDYQDFTGTELGAVSAGAESFGDARAIAAQACTATTCRTSSARRTHCPPGCNITVRGIAPGASLVGLRVSARARPRRLPRGSPIRSTTPSQRGST
jgi:hypothetical protein